MRRSGITCREGRGTLPLRDTQRRSCMKIAMKQERSKMNEQGITLKDEERTRCEIWTRVMGYHRPVTSFNPGKQAEYAERRNFEECRIPASG